MDNLLEEILGNNEALAYFYCKRDENGSSDPEVLLRTVVKQLSHARVGSSLQEPVLNFYRSRKHEDFASGPLRFEESVDLIISLVNLYPQTTLIIDALDECDMGKRGNLLTALTRILGSSAKLVKVFVSSRDDDDIKYNLQKVPNVYINAKDNTADIDRFVNFEIAKSIEDGKLLRGRVPEGLKQHIISTLTKGANGMYIPNSIYEISSTQVTTIACRIWSHGRFGTVILPLLREVLRAVLSSTVLTDHIRRIVSRGLFLKTFEPANASLYTGFCGLIFKSNTFAN